MQKDNKLTGNLPLITIAVIAYNQEKYVKEAIDGALSQTYSPLEVIFSDDCSTDRTFDIMEDVKRSYVGPHNLVTNRNDENLGVCAHVNRVAALAKGELLVMAAGDDVSESIRVETVCREWLASGRPSAVHSQWYDIDARGKLICCESEGNKTPNDNMFKWTDAYFREHIRLNYYGFVGATFSYSLSDVFKNYPPLDEKMVNEDQVLPTRAALENGILVISDKLVRYRRHENNLYNSIRNDQTIDVLGAEKRQKLNRQRRIIRYKAHLIDFGISGARNAAQQSLPKISAELQSQIRVLNVLVDWWDLPIFRRIFAFCSIVLPFGNRGERKWAAKRLIPRFLFLFRQRVSTKRTE